MLNKSEFKNYNVKNIFLYILLLIPFFMFLLFFFLEIDLTQILFKQKQIIITYKDTNLLFIFCIIFVMIVFNSFLSLPGAMIFLTLTSGFFLGSIIGFLTTIIASNLGSIITFLFIRSFYKEQIKKSFFKKISFIKTEVNNHGIYYLFALRVIPIVPNFIVNITMPFTSIKFIEFFLISLIGTIPGAFIIANSGAYLETINSASDILSLKTAFYLILIGLLPLLSNLIIKKMNKKIK